jgi:hypothetical protein
MDQIAQVVGTPLGVGSQLGDYVIEQLLGCGTEGAVYRARDVVLGRRVALKTVRDGSTAHTRCVEEARLMARIDHPSVVRVYHAQRYQRIWYVALEYAGYGSLQSRIKSLGTLVPREALNLLEQAIEGLNHVHRLGIVHRDVKPQNMLLTTEDKLKISDFGLATEVRGPEFRAPGMVGTPAFLAPERWDEGGVDAAGDVYSLGVCLFYMLTAQLPFPSKSADQLRRAHASSEPRLPEEIPRGVRQLVSAMMAKAPDARPKLNGELIREVRRLRDVPRASFHHEAERALAPSVWASHSAVSASTCVMTRLEAYRFECERLVMGGQHCAVVASDTELLDRFWWTTNQTLGSEIRTLARLQLGAGELGPIGQLRERAGMNGHGALGLALMSLLERTGQAKTGVVEVRSRFGTSEGHLGELGDLIRAASESSVVVVCLLADPGHHFDASRPRALNVLHLPHRGDAAGELIRAWATDATAGRFSLSADAVRLLTNATVHERRPWVGVLEQSIAIAGANAQHVVPSWAVLRALKSIARINDVMDVPAELRRRPASWPPSDVLELLKKLRHTSSEAGLGLDAADARTAIGCFGAN